MAFYFFESGAPTCWLKDFRVKVDVHAKLGGCPDSAHTVSPIEATWAGRHPRGGRVSDKIAWAIEYLGQHGYRVAKKSNKSQGGDEPTLF